ncbi:MAG: hypothetical protein AAB533_00640 [Patescibacteria group bacterium]
MEQIPTPIWYTITPKSVFKETVQETSDLEQSPYYVLIDIHAQEIAELRARISRLEEQQASGQQIISIAFLESEKLILKRPIIATLLEGETYIVDNAELNLYGEGEDETRAIRDFKVVLEESYFSLKKDQEYLGPELKRRWGILQQIIQEK